MTAISVDTSVLIGLLDPQDIWHRPALALIDAVEKNELEVFYFDCVLAEAVSTIARRLHEKRREGDLSTIIERLEEYCPRPRITWVLPDVPRLYSTILDLVQESQGELNFNDALIALSCRERGIPLLASFDQDFDQVVWLKRVAAPDDLVG